MELGRFCAACTIALFREQRGSTLNVGRNILNGSPRKEGMKVPSTAIYPTPQEFATLFNEGWKLLIAEDGRVLAYLPPPIPTLAQRLGR